MNCVSSIELMPKPFDWIDVPAGRVTLREMDCENDGFTMKVIDFDVSAFAIAKYPVTNAQFAVFISAGGYNQQKWWTKDGWQERLNEDWQQPRFWNEAEFNKPDYPVVGVSWYEVIAFCQWLSELSAENITLPTEQQWQWAAQGDTRWSYPYGDHFDEARCNFNTQGTTSVLKYEGKDKGDSPFGVVDMSGNVWEWCLTKYDTNENRLDGNDVRVLRGGSWASGTSVHLRADYRDGYHPSYGDDLWGFRIARL